ncbi:MAG: alpha/beta fold hydrolase [Chloroflexota bacterium]|nr:alpha/beta fold hydrolase [Chloroflexota bacterium]
MQGKNGFAKSPLLVVLLLLLNACGGESSLTPIATIQANPSQTILSPPLVTTLIATPNLSVAPTATSVPPTTIPALPTLAPTATSVPPTAAPLPTPALSPRYIEALRKRTYNGGEIKLERLYSSTNAYTANLITYQSDGLKISGLIFVPNGPSGKKYPVALINHGFFPTTPGAYDSGWDTLRELMFFARNGYITLASDYRNYARSDKGDNELEPGYAIDLLNLIEAVKKFPQADPNQITIMGHSMGGEITLTAMVVNKDLKVAGLFGTMSPDAADNYYARIKWGGRTNQKWIETYGTPDNQPEVYRQMSPLTYFKDVKVPVIIHSGNNDTTTPPAWSVKTRDALLAAGKKAELYTYPGEGHSLNGVAFDQAMQRTLSFFNSVLGR